MAKVKTCNTCGKTLPLTAFSRHHGTKDKKQGRCRDCMRDLNRSVEVKPEDYLDNVIETGEVKFYGIKGFLRFAFELTNHQADVSIRQWERKHGIN